MLLENLFEIKVETSENQVEFFSFHKSKDRDNAGVRSDEIYAGAKNSLVELA